jgi:hypothetical protein
VTSQNPQSAIQDLPQSQSIRPRASLGWALRRALIGLTILTIFVAGSALLLHASIEPDAGAQQDSSE